MSPQRAFRLRCTFRLCWAWLAAAMVACQATPLAAAQLTLSAASTIWRPAVEPSPLLTVQVANDTAQDVLADRLTSWQLGLRLVPRLGAAGTLGFGPPSLPAGYLLSGRNIGLFQGPSPSDQLLVTDGTSQGNANAVVVPPTATPLLALTLTQQAARGVFDLVAQRNLSFWIGRESLDPAERPFANFPSEVDQVTLATITVVPALVGDANDDCGVGAADYAIWAAQFGQTGAGLSADFDGNGSIGAGDYALWAANFGNTCPVAVTGVPEPSSWALALAGMAGIALIRRAVARR